MVKIPIAFILVGCTACAIVAGAAPGAAAQAIHGTLSGRVLDTSRAPVGEAVVTIINAATNAPIVTVTDAAGLFRFQRLSPGEYQLLAEKGGFRQHVQHGVAVAVNQQVSAEIVLEVGAIEDRVVVEATLPVVQSTSAEVSGLIDQKRVRIRDLARA